MMNMQENQTYETPKIEVVEVNLENSIAVSGQGVSLWEELWG